MTSILESPKEIEYGSATEPRAPKHFDGRSGVWACERCNRTRLLAKGTKQWICEQCNTLMYTTPRQECPLEKARRYFVGVQKEKNATRQKEARESMRSSRTLPGGVEVSAEKSADTPATKAEEQTQKTKAGEVDAS